MKKLFFLSVFVLVFITMYGQTQRMVLVEEYTNASCAPCAAANPAFNVLLDANPTKVIPIKFQWYYPGYDPMNAQNPTEPNARMGYYAQNGVPTGVVDGNYYIGHVSNITQAQIDAEYAIASPFTMTATHTISPNLDTVHITVTITASQAFTANGALKCQIALTENEIHFATAPGGNGEKDFFEVMRKMYPDVNGTAMAGNWTVGQTQTIQIDAPLPSYTNKAVVSYLYDINQVAIVAFIQDNGNKNIKQAIKSVPLIQNADLNLDAGLSQITGIAMVNCANSISPIVVLKNYKSTLLTTATLNWMIDNGTIQTQSWSGSLALNATANINLPAQTLTDGEHSISFWVSSPNGAPELYQNNNFLIKKTFIVSNYVALPVAQSFQVSTFPPSGWINEDIDSDGNGWELSASAGGFGQSTKSTMMNFYDSPNAKIDNLYTPSLNLTGLTNAYLRFDVAYARYNATNDRLKVQVSTNCGTTWATPYDKNGAGLETAPATTSAFVPTATQWRVEEVDLSSYTGNAQVLVRFSGVSNYGNNAYVDNVNLSIVSVAGINDNVSTGKVNIFPNPFNESTTLSIELNANSSFKYEIYNILGDVVYSETEANYSAGSYSFNIDGNGLNAGIYFVKIQINKELVTKKITITR